jgi:hypothetical protein
MTQNWVNSGNGAAFMNIRDPSNNFAFGMRTFFDQDGYGSDENCPSNTNSGVDKIRSATDWLSANGRRGFLVEFGAGGSSGFIFMCLFEIFNVRSLQTIASQPFIMPYVACKGRTCG